MLGEKYSAECSQATDEMEQFLSEHPITDRQKLVAAVALVTNCLQNVYKKSGKTKTYALFGEAVSLIGLTLFDKMGPIND